MCSRPFETRSRPALSRRYRRGFAFYVAFPKNSIRPLGLPIYVARVPAAPFARSYPRHFNFYAWHAVASRHAVALREGWSAKAGRTSHSLH